MIDTKFLAGGGVKVPEGGFTHGNPIEHGLKTCTGVLINNINDESMFFGTVTVIGGSGESSGGGFIGEQMGKINT